MEEGECNFSMSDSGDFYVSSHVKSVFDKHGYILVRQLLNTEEVSKLREHFETDNEIQKYAYGRSDGNNRVTKVCLWNKAGDDFSGNVAR